MKENTELNAIVGALMIELERLKKSDPAGELMQRILGYIDTDIGLKVHTLAQVLSVPRSTIYYHHTQPHADELLRSQIEAVLAEHSAYGHSRIAMALGIDRKRVRRVMNLLNLKPYKRKARWRKRRDEKKASAPYSNLTKGICPIAEGVVWVSDFTYLNTNTDTYIWQHL